MATFQTIAGQDGDEQIVWTQLNGSAQPLLAANANRRYVSITNPSATAVLYIGGDLNVTATPGNNCGWPVQPGQTETFEVKGAITVIGTNGQYACTLEAI